MPAKNLGVDFTRAYELGLFRVEDPGASGTISWNSIGDGICRVTTAAAESRALADADQFGVGTTLTVILETDGGDLTVTSDDTNVIIENAGDLAIFKVSRNQDSTQNEWRILNAPVGSVQGTNTVQIPITSFRSGVALSALSPTTATELLLGIVSGTHGSAQPTLRANVLDKSDDAAATARVQVQIPTDYVAGTDLTFIIAATEVDAASTTATLEVDAVLVAATPGSDLESGGAQDITSASATDFSYTITGTVLTPGQLLDIVLTVTLDDDQGDGVDYTFANPRLSYTAKQ